MALYPLSQLPTASSTALRAGTAPELAGDDWFASQGAPPPGDGGGFTVPSDVRSATTYPDGALPAGAGSAPPAPTGPPPSDRAGITQWVTQQLAQYGIQPGPRGSGVGDVEYWADQMLDPVNTGYGDWAGRIQRGVQGTQPPLAGGGAGGPGYGPSGGLFGLGVNLPSMEGFEGSPGYQFRLGEGLKALERSAASRGTLLTGGTLKGLERYGQNLASQEYANEYARRLGETQLGLGAQQQRYGQLLGVGQLGLGYGQMGAGTAGQQGALGSQYAGLAGNLLGGQAQGIGDWLTQRGNAAAAGTVGGANAWQNALGQGTNLATQMYLLSQLGGGDSGQAQRQIDYWNQGNTGPVK
jgi:hypothetical protein